MTITAESIAIIRVGIFACLFFVFAAMEAMWPRRSRGTQRRPRWLTNVSLAALGSVLVKLALPIGAAGFALWVASKNYGLFNVLEMHSGAAIAIAIVGLDCAIYWQHVAFHRIDALWRWHQVHHADTDLDVSSGFRFHPGEILISFGFKLFLIAVFGIHWIAVVVFEILLNGFALFNHANLRLPLPADRFLRRIIVTPDMHRVHHSTLATEQQMNFGFSLALWDRWFNSYQAEPAAGHNQMQIGLQQVSQRAAARLPNILLLPFRRN